MTRPAYIQARIDQINKRNAWQAAIEDTEPLVMVTLGTNRGMSEAKLRELIDRALLALDRRRLGFTRRPHKWSALNRVCAFIMVEKADVNAHAHLLIYSPARKRRPDSSLVRNFDETRIRHDFIGLKGRDYDPALYEDDRRLAPRLEIIWRELVPGGHYHARRVDDQIAHGVDYTLKELPFVFERDVGLSQEAWPSKQKHIERTLQLNRCLRAKKAVV